MLTEEFRTSLINLLKEKPQEAIDELRRNPKLLDILLQSEGELTSAKKQIDTEKAEKIKYVNLTTQRENQLKEIAQKLKTTQGALIGLGIILLLAYLDKHY